MGFIGKTVKLYGSSILGYSAYGAIVALNDKKDMLEKAFKKHAVESPFQREMIEIFRPVQASAFAYAKYAATFSYLPHFQKIVEDRFSGRSR